MEKYVYVAWSDNVQAFMEYPWFHEECILDTDSASDYLVPVERYWEVMRDQEKQEPLRLLIAAADWIATIKDEEGSVNFDDNLEHEIAAYIAKNKILGT